ncbi:MAG: Na+/H+ antiporter NhaA [Candidatus Odinarchaeota archaeon]
MSSIDKTISKNSEVPIERIFRPIREFIKTEESSGILLVAFTLIALVWANSPFSAVYTELWGTTLTVGIESFKISKSLLLWINDGLMAIFFFVVGLEIKRELLVGELNTPSKAILPVSAAIGGMVVPAAIYMVLNLSNPASFAGWAVPMATDIAFALGVLALLGKRAPLSLKIFLTSLAIVDDLGAVAVIAIFYTSNIDFGFILLALGVFIVLIVINKLGAQNHLAYAALGLVLWIFILKSGVHATIAGVLLALTIPATRRIDADVFLEKSKIILDKFQNAGKREQAILLNDRQQSAIKALEINSQNVEAPLQRFERGLHYWVTHAVMPVFILANAGVSLAGVDFTALINPITLGIILGLFTGKSTGVSLFAYLSVKTGLTDLPKTITWRHIIGGSFLAGIGFTMSLFITSLAFTDQDLISLSKLGILAGSLISGAVGMFILSREEIVEEPIDDGCI